MRLVIVGASGRTGAHILEQARARGHEATAFCRSAARVRGPASHVVEGDARTVADLLPAVRGRDAVLTAVTADHLGPNEVVSQITLAVIHAMQQTGVSRIAVTSARPVVASRPWLPVWITWLAFRNAYRDLARAEGMLQASGLDWRVVRAPRLHDGAGTGRLHVDGAWDATGGGWQLARADFAKAMLDAVEDDTPVHRAIGVGAA